MTGELQGMAPQKSSSRNLLRALDKLADQEQERSARLEKALADYQAQANKPFDHEARMKELLARQAQASTPRSISTRTKPKSRHRRRMISGIRANLSLSLRPSKGMLRQR
jgi:hypothetical protein